MTGDGIECTDLTTVEEVADPCNPSPCYPGVFCTTSGNVTAACGPCPYRMTGDGRTCVDHSPCGSSPCFEGVACFPLGEEFVCGHCPPGMTGNGTHCADLFSSNNLCAHEETNPCFDRSLCVPEKHSGAALCTSCPPGYKGDGIFCEEVVVDPCGGDDNPCHPESSCNAVNGIATCGPCPENMTGNGKVCHKKDPCADLPCYEGVGCEVDYSEVDGFRL